MVCIRQLLSVFLRLQGLFVPLSGRECWCLMVFDGKCCCVLESVGLWKEIFLLTGISLYWCVLDTVSIC